MLASLSFGLGKGLISNKRLSMPSINLHKQINRYYNCFLKDNTFKLGKPKMPADSKRIVMSEADRIARLHELLKDPVRQRILLKLGEHDKLSFDELLKELKIDDQQELYDELQVLGNLVKKIANEGCSQPKDVFKTFSDQYILTEEGHDTVEEMIAFPEIESDNFNEKMFNKNGEPKQNFTSSPKQQVMVFLAILIVAIIIIFLIVLYFHVKDLRGYGRLSLLQLKVLG